MPESFPRAPLWRRLAALVYDYLLGAAVFMLAHFLGFVLLALLALLFPGLTQGYPDLASYISASHLYKGYLLLCVLGFFVWFWTHGGQTLGMRAWRLKVQRQGGGRLGLGQALLRALVGLGGVGLLWMLVSRQRLALHDRLAGSEVVELSQEANKLKNWQGL
ncbi:RDD family protein [Gallaecimonas xiamenensis]|uniref:RDD domain-containing protein n=1 Tax=Gallaecimonas xiamenensis 3-C-1 TaxID=745411 RepID=K2KBZ8_9GAMM|nr:RDD family protein [Gallaecimonas xiamenensis]EKE74885.1 RDD domain-containing protein [Gallaecimonas xiamenensis 3-C-1]